MENEEVKQEEVNEEKQPENQVDELVEFKQQILAKLDEMAKDIAEVKARQDEVEDEEEEYEKIAY